jgi:hypothetical protein
MVHPPSHPWNCTYSNGRQDVELKFGDMTKFGEKFWHVILFTLTALLFVARVILVSDDKGALVGQDAGTLWFLLLLGGISIAALILWRTQRSRKSKLLVCCLFGILAITLGVYLWKGLLT